MKNASEADVLGYIKSVEESIQPDADYYYNLYSGLSGISVKLSEEGDEELAGVMRCLALIAFMALDANSKNEPIVPAMRLFDRASYAPKDITVDERKILDDLYPELSTGLLKTRIAEIFLFLDTPRRWDLVDEIIQGYLIEDLSEHRWHVSQQNLWTRALSLSRIYKKNEYIDKIELQIFNYIDRKTPEDAGICISLFNFIKEQGIQSSEIDRIPALIMHHALYLKKTNNWHFAERLYVLASDFYSIPGCENEHRHALFESAECLFLEAEQRAESDSQGNMIASGLYTRAMQRYRTIPNAYRNALGADVRIEESLKRARRHGEMSLDDMHTFQLPAVDLSELVEIAVNHVKDRGHIFKSCLYFVGLNHITVKSLKDNDESRRTLISDLFGSLYLSADGRAIGRSGHGKDSISKAHAEQLRSFDFSLKMTVVGEIIPAMNQLIQEYNFVLPFFKELCHVSPLVHQDRIELTARGLYLGFEYRFSESIHVLAPQVEHLVRDMLKKANVRTSFVDDNGIENEVALGSLLDKPEAEEIFSEDILFNLKSLFTEPLGANIRNYVAHGLMTDNSSQSEAVVYAWWLCLKLIVMSVTQCPVITIPLHEEGYRSNPS